MKTIRLELPGGRQIAALHYGPDSSRSYVFLHGTGYSGWAWKPDEQHLQELGYSFIVPQRPGIGESGPLAGFTVTQVIEDLALLLQSIGIQSVKLLAYSTGAAYGAAFTWKNPSLVHSLGFIHPALPFTASSPLPARWRNLQRLMRYAPFLLRRRIRQGEALFKRDPEAFLAHMVRHAVIADKVLFEQLHFRLALIEDIRMAYRQGWTGIWDDLRALYGYDWNIGNIPVPITVWQGKSEDSWSVDTAKELGKMNPEAQLHLLTNAGAWIGINGWPEALSRDLGGYSYQN